MDAMAAQVSWRSVANIFLSDFMSPRQKVGFHWMVKMCMPCQVRRLPLVPKVDVGHPHPPP
jgi:hypothetical protein